ncbi:MAG: hypothetical protein KatS3mg060_2192 [Dehalococcoidia bacterium]|nr:MAG: hypothetical protein KatS3mg060_2192 [Dehalococcoidia bacterium]
MFGGEAVELPQQLIQLAQAARQPQCQLHPGKVDPPLFDQRLDLKEPVEIFRRVQPEIPFRARRLEEAGTLVFPQRLRVHLHDACRHGNDVLRLLDHHARSP